MSDPRFCLQCGIKLIQKIGEKSDDWAYRQFCSRTCSNRNRRPPVEQRFWSLVEIGEPDQCWNWTGARQERGYGKYLFEGKVSKSSRVAWILTYGPVPDGLHVLHNCPEGDNPRCCNPRHLWLGTHQHNMDDMVAKGRDNRGIPGEANHNAKLTNEQVRQARQRYANRSGTIKGMARELGVSKRTMQLIIQNRSWQHLLAEES